MTRLASRRDPDEVIDEIFHLRFNLDVRLGPWKELEIRSEDLEVMMFDVIVFLSRCGGRFDFNTFYRELPASSFVVIHQVITEALYYRFLSTSYDTVELTLRGMKWMTERADRYLRHATKRDQAEPPFTLAEGT